ncbi:ImmA/IrrE family metallo-endopeptidase (plasmid) [Deinococcus psychrotolerans]|uniref:ImmA/IrrE family metallo-endopeptidase n=1 Tax=Deinococcus psychrotolerans TaxID=2489213 RepID=A0A3G8YK31_9DEIO|nr:XRE family transcriptional regulator [Deinococcus psychrotolerans]AZI45303.1 ImmA/IrrE family metallo-endopeptidase [Deinococcus psychrotolerans]
MTPHRPNFSGARLTQAREVLGWTKSELSRAVGLTPAAVGGYEDGKITPSSTAMEALASALQQPLAFFTLPPPSPRTGTVFYRSYSGASKKARLIVQAQVTLLWDQVDYLCDFVTLPKVDMPRIGALPKDPTEITEDMIISIAQRAREHWNLRDNPAPNIVWLLEGSGAIVVRLDLKSDQMEAMSEWRGSDQRPYIVLNTVKRNAFRSRADIAHELGHLLLHRNVEQQMLEDKAAFKLIEKQAWLFAQEFLLPEQAFLKDVYSLSLDALKMLKPKWKVSIAFMLHRIHSLDILSEEKYSNYRKYLAQRGWLKTEPFDAETEPERPLMLSQAFEFITGQKVQTADQIADKLSQNREMLEAITQVKEGFFVVERRKNPFILSFKSTG